MNKIKLAFDVMGSDRGCYESVLASYEFALQNKKVALQLVGTEKALMQAQTKILQTKKTEWPENITFFYATEVILQTDGPLAALRKKTSSMTSVIHLLKNNDVQGILSAGSTSAFIAGCYSLLGTLERINRPALMPLLPTKIANRKVALLDCGANLENSVEDLMQFAIMAHYYMETVEKKRHPKIALLNIGEEANKGLALNKAAYEYFKTETAKGMKLSFLNFIGNIEPGMVMHGAADIIVCPGYIGNIFLKTAEGSMKLLLDLIKTSYHASLWNKILGGLSKGVFKRLRKDFNYKNTGGALLLGVNGCVVKAHGSSDQQSYRSALQLLLRMVEMKTLAKIKTKINDIKQ